MFFMAWKVQVIKTAFWARAAGFVLILGLASGGCARIVDAPVPNTAVTFRSLAVNNGGTSVLTLTFDKAVPGLSAEDIILADTGGTGIQKGELAAPVVGADESAVYRLSVSGITKSGEVSVKVGKAGYVFTVAERSAKVQASWVLAASIVFQSLETDGWEKVATSELTLKFSQAVPGLSAEDITLADTGGTGIQKGELAAPVVGADESAVYRLSVSGITKSGEVSVKVEKTGRVFTPNEQTVWVYWAVPFPIAFQSLEADGEGTEFTSALTLTFDKAIEELSAEDITLADTGDTGIQKGELAAPVVGADELAVYRLSVSGITRNGEVSVKVKKAGYEFTPSEQTVEVYVVQVTFLSLKTNGFEGSDEDSRYLASELTLEFSQAVPGLSAEDITLEAPESTGIQKGELLDVDPVVGADGSVVYRLSVSRVTKSGKVLVKVKKAGYEFTPAERSVKVNVVPVEFWSLEANDVGTVGTLALKFSQVVPGLSAADITLTDTGGTGIQKGEFAASSPSDVGAGGSAIYRLEVSGVTRSGEVSVKVKKAGYEFTPSEQTVVVNVVPVTFQSLEADGRGTKPTTALTLKFSQAVSRLSAADITLTDTDGTGIHLQEGALTALGGGEYRLSVSGITRNGEVSVKVGKAGYVFTAAERSVKVWSPPVALLNVEADGSSVEATTELRLKFDRDADDLLAPDMISVDDVGETDIQKGELTALGGGIYRLAVSGIHRDGEVRIVLSEYKDERYVFAPFVAATYVYRGPMPKPAAFTVTANGEGTASTTELKLVFNWNATRLPLEDITLEDPESTGIQKVALMDYSSSLGEANYTLSVDGITKSGTVTVKVAPQIDYYTYAPEPQEVQVYAFQPVTAKFLSVSADGPGGSPTTVLYLKFDKDIPYLTAEDITLEDPNGTGVQKEGPLVRTAPGAYSLVVDDVTKSGEITVRCEFTTDTYTVQVYAPPASLSLSANGRNGATAARLSPADITPETPRRRRHTQIPAL